MGGQSRRFGSDKATHSLDGQTFVDHLVDATRQAEMPLVLVGRGADGLPSDVPLLPDDPAGKGPAAGLAAALEHATQEGRKGVLLLACDQPGVGTELLEYLVGVANEEPDAALALVGETGLEPFPAYYPVGLLETARTQRSLRGVLKEARPATRVASVAERASLPGWVLTNINTPADLEEFVRRRRSP